MSFLRTISSRVSNSLFSTLDVTTISLLRLLTRNKLKEGKYRLHHMVAERIASNKMRQLLSLHIEQIQKIRNAYIYKWTTLEQPSKPDNTFNSISYIKYLIGLQQIHPANGANSHLLVKLQPMPQGVKVQRQCIALQHGLDDQIL